MSVKEFCGLKRMEEGEMGGGGGRGGGGEMNVLSTAALRPSVCSTSVAD